MCVTKEKIRKIIELTAHEDEPGGDVWGDDTILGTMDELISEAFTILENKGEDYRDFEMYKDPNEEWLFLHMMEILEYKYSPDNSYTFKDVNFNHLTELESYDWESVRSMFMNVLNELRIYYICNRLYHNLEHIKTMDDKLLELTEDVDSPWYKYCKPDEIKLLRLAIVFHDIIYVPGGSYNEEMSADYAKNVLNYFGYSQKEIDTVVDLIYHTKVFLHKDINIKENDVMNLMHDLDFYTFSLPYKKFKENNKSVIEEQKILGRDLKWFQDNWYSYLLAEIKKGWRLYCTPYAQKNWEPVAIKNLKRIMKESEL